MTHADAVRLHHDLQVIHTWQIVQWVALLMILLITVVSNGMRR